MTSATDVGSYYICSKTGHLYKLVSYCEMPTVRFEPVAGAKTDTGSSFPCPIACGDGASLMKNLVKLVPEK